MHMAVYAGTEAAAIVHVHPPMVLAFSLAHDSFVPLSFEEKYTIGEVPVIAQDTPTVTRPEKVVEELKYHPVVIIKGHGTVAIGNSQPLGAAGVYALLAANAGLIGHCVTSTGRASVAAPGADSATVGNAAIAWAIPCGGETPPVVFDSACGATSWGWAEACGQGEVAQVIEHLRGFQGRLGTSSAEQLEALPDDEDWKRTDFTWDGMIGTMSVESGWGATGKVVLDFSKPETYVRFEWTHAEFIRQTEGLLVVSFGFVDVEGMTMQGDFPEQS